MDNYSRKITDREISLDENKIWYKTASELWDQGLPIGNGRLAAMVLNQYSEDVLTLNHEGLWVGSNVSREIYSSADNALEKVRGMLSDGEYEKATLYATDNLGRNAGDTNKINRTDSYQPVGNLHIKLNDLTLSKRELSLENGIVTVKRESDRCECTGRIFAHCIDEKIYGIWKGAISGEIFIERAFDENASESVDVSDGCICYSVEFKDKTAFEVSVKIHTDGAMTKKSNKINIENGKYLIIVVDVQLLNNKYIEKNAPLALESYDKDNIADKAESTMIQHAEHFSSYMKRLSLKIDCDKVDLPTDERLAAFKNGSADENMFALYLNYARYLMISSSICAKLPINLQGKWNNDLQPAWNSDYHFDINLQMAYWIAENGNLSEMTSSLFDYIDSFNDSARKAAKRIYGCNGILLPLSSDARGIASMDSYGWDIWIGAAPWIAQHYYKHYEYTGDTKFLKERAYPYFDAVVEFYEDYLVCDKDGVYQITPSISPENSFLENKDIHISLCISSAMDVQLAYDCFTYAIKAAEILKIDSDKTERRKQIRENLPDFKIGSDGRLLEWNKEFKEKEPGHRHLSHLYGVFPSNIFTPERNTEQFSAAQKSLDFRLKHLGGHTGWSRAWCACLYARFGRASEFYKHIRYLIDNFSTSSLLDLHPPRIFQIDGNLGGAEAILQALLQCNDGKIYLLPALPENWQDGEINGIKTVGGHTVSFKWTKGKVRELNIEYGFEDEVIFKFNDGFELKTKKTDRSVPIYFE